KVRVTGARRKNNNPAQLEMPNGAAEDEWLRHVFHFNRGLDASLDTDLLQCAAQREGINYCGKHPHVIRRGTIHAAIRGRKAAPDVAASDYDGHLHAKIAHLLDALGDLANYRRRNIVASPTLLDSFAAELKHDPFIDWRICLHDRR